MANTTHSLGIPDDFARATREVHGERGDRWLAGLPSLLERYAERWSLTLLPHFPDLTYNYVLPAVRAGGEPVVVKAGVPCDELLREIDALAWYGGHGAARLLDAEGEEGVLLLERLAPGISLRDISDESHAATIAAGVMRRLRRPAPVSHAFPSVADWGRGFERLRARFGGGYGPFPAELVDAAERTFGELLDSMAAPVLLHGDLHHGNILVAEREGWLAIDPKGVIGEPAYETGAWLRNPLPALLDAPHPERLAALRAEIFASELGLDRDRVVAWAFAQAVLSAWWSYEDHGRGWEPAMMLARHLKKLL